MLDLRPNCECCNRDLAPDSSDARICSYECTFCATCVETKLGGVCPNCGGNFAPRPIRPAAKLIKDPPSAKRVFQPEGCAKRPQAAVQPPSMASIAPVMERARSDVR